MTVQIEQGEYFVVTRGFAFGGGSFGSFLNPFGMVGGVGTQEVQQHDRSDEGKVFKALAVCGPMIAAECVYAEGYKSDSLGQRKSLNTTEVEVWPVTREYAESLLATLSENPA